MNIEKDIVQALEQIANIYTSNEDLYKNNFSKLYAYTTENIKGYFNKLDLTDKKVLVTGSSGDQIFSAISRGVKDITCFDLNPLIKYYYELKKAAIKALSYREFLDFFDFNIYNEGFLGNLKSLNINTYYKISPYLSKESKYFWDSIYMEFDGYKIRLKLFFKDYTKAKYLKKVTCYLCKEDYYSLRDKLDHSDVKFIRSDIRNLKNHLHEKYDYILLSNIFQYISFMYDTDELEKMRDIILGLDKFLNENGQIGICYLYEFNRKFKYKQNYYKIYNFQEVKRLLGDKNISLLTFKGVNQFYNCFKKADSVIMYKNEKGKLAI